MFRWLVNLISKPTPGRMRATRMLRARYDAAVTNNDNRRHWAGADGLSANAANNAEVRRILRNRARYEIANNSYARGIVLTLANDAIGTGPRLQLLTEDAAANHRMELEFMQWAKAINLAEKLRTMRMSRAQDGEVFAVLTSNPQLPTAIQLDLRLIEADQVCTPDLNVLKSNSVDGIVFDEAGNPVEYHILKSHPGEAVRFTRDYDRLPAAAVVHWFRLDRPGQARGIPDIMPALPLFAQLRRFTLAVLAAAETAADFAGILYTDAPANGEADAAEPFEPIELEQRALLTMPGGWKMSQMQAEQPATTHAEFKREILNEIARCLNMPAKKGVQKAGLWITTRFWPTSAICWPIRSGRSRHSGPPSGRSTDRRPCSACSGDLLRSGVVSSRVDRVINQVGEHVDRRLDRTPERNRSGLSDISPREAVGNECTPDAFRRRMKSEIGQVRAQCHAQTA
jgi:hypothetical protein